MNMNSLNWFSDLSSILTQDLATAAVDGKKCLRGMCRLYVTICFALH